MLSQSLIEMLQRIVGGCAQNYRTPRFLWTPGHIRVAYSVLLEHSSLLLLEGHTKTSTEMDAFDDDICPYQDLTFLCLLSSGSVSKSQHGTTREWEKITFQKNLKTWLICSKRNQESMPRSTSWQRWIGVRAGDSERNSVKEHLSTREHSSMTENSLTRGTGNGPNALLGWLLKAL